ncbi:replication initiation protein [Spirosoma sp. BT702]|uniref:Replication initiation protein n=1 Tax=Spirosoma profusum TaxID=2771354 RepID=A0A926XYT3_9BACT|nr:replication initiation protein [Spirosoma profusum]MBD2703388.1 replication initiation protein [Spirosoma profusum]
MRKSSPATSSLQLSSNQLSLTFESSTVTAPVEVNPETIVLRTSNNKTILIREPLKLLTSTTEFGFFERRLYWLVLREIRNIQAIDKLKIKPYEEIKFRFHYSEVIKGHPNATIKKVIDLIQKRTINWEDENGKHTNVVVFPMAEYWPKKGVIELTMYHAVIPVFLYLGSGYAQYGYEDALILSSEYAQLLFTNLARFRTTGIWRVNLVELRQLIGAHEKSYNNYSAFRTRVIDLSLRQINEHTNLQVSYEPLMQGRAVIGLVFSIQTKAAPEELEKETKKAEIRQRLDELLQTDIADLISYAAKQLQTYYPSFTSQQRKAILTNSENLKAFIRADLYAEYGFAEKDPEAYVAQSVFNYKKNKAGEQN